MDPSTVETQIEAYLQTLEERAEIRILYACESGSRAWGFASPDSDYDVRFIFTRPLSAYLSVRESPDSLDEISGDLDFAGWDLRKAAHRRCLSKRNTPAARRPDGESSLSGARWRTP